MTELFPNLPLFVGFKVDSGLRRQLENVSGSDRQYVADDGSGYLSLCKIGDDSWVGIVIRDRITTDRVEDIRRSVLSILTRLAPETRLPTALAILACSGDSASIVGT